jgi:hypothetical protein
MIGRRAFTKRVSLFGLIFLLLVFFGACTHKPYHPVKSEKEWTADHEACEKWAREGIRDEPDTYDAMDEMKMIKHCMKQKGWTWKRTGLFQFGGSDQE